MALYKYLFTDDSWIAGTYAVHRRVGSFAKDHASPLLVADRPWEGSSVYCYGTCLVEDRHYRLWYQVYNNKAADLRFRSAVAYAESTDGRQWEKPLVGAIHPEFGPTNLVALSTGRSSLYSPSVVRDDTDPDPARRYKMMIWDAMSEEDLARYGSPFPKCADVPGWCGIEGEGLFTLVSPDGIVWERHTTPIVGSPSDASVLCQLADRSFLATFKTSARDDRHFRVIAESGSDDFSSWSEPRVVLESDWRDATGTEFYGLAAFEYFGNRLGFLWIYHNAPDDKRMDVQLASWTAEAGWQRAADRQTILATGDRGQWDAGSVITASAPVIMPPHDPNRLWLFYAGSTVRHDDARYRRNEIGLATMRLDGFASMEAGYFPGTLGTCALMPLGGRLFLNVVAPHGELSITVLDASDQNPIARSLPMQGPDATALPVMWENAFLFSQDKPVILEFSLHRASLFSFWFAD
jgi:hypothetical protein